MLHEVVYSPGASFDRAVPGIQEYMRACAEKVAAALPWVVPTPEAAGSCWDAAPQVIREGVHDPMPTLCELTAGHQGAHRSGRTEWMHSRPLTPTDDEREAQANRLASCPDVGTGFRRTEVPEPSAEEDELAPGECDGSGKCAAERHIHGCYTPHRADQCDAPEEYGHLPSEPQGEPSDLVRRLVELRSDMRHNADEVATLDAAITALGAQGEPSDAQVEAAWAVLERDGLTVLERIHVRDALRAAGVLCEPSAPDGWFVFGSHAPYPWVGKMEFSAEQDEAGMPLWERPVQGEPSDDEREAITDEGLWDFASDLLDAWSIDDLNPPSLLEDFRDRFVRRFRRSEVPEPSTEDEFALQVTVRAEPIGGGKESLDVDVDIVEPSTPAWAAGLLRQIADDLAPEPQGDPSDAQVRAIRVAFADELTRLGVYSFDIHEIRKSAAGGAR
ncbi:hypothetical protein [uncultured Microbacterium sp.]|uniref:hypothetical protein n=1 Tax=uncultured Microbacterium sp. TaxID=191216 RepID=UPI0025F54420|nr:hypothetical protein [uncultured Microbacterium sp.]